MTSVTVALYALLIWLVVRDAEVFGSPRRRWEPEPRWQAAEMRMVRYAPLRDNIGGWAVICGRGLLSNRLLGILAEPYDDLMPVLPFLVTRWRISLLILGRVVFGWNRYTKLDELKMRMPVLRAGMSAWTLRPYHRTRFGHGHA